MENSKVPGRRSRRTKEDLERELFNAAVAIVEREGFGGLSVTGLIREAKVDPPVFYNRYKDINEFIDKFVRNYDYWLNDSVHIDMVNESPSENIKKISLGLVDALLENAVMQKLLAWEMCEDSYITQRTAQNRDNNSIKLIRYFENTLKDCEVNFNASTAILLGGVYYLLIHRRLATFNRVDFNTPEGIELLKKTLSVMVSKIYADSKQVKVLNNNNAVEIARSLIKNNVELSIIEESTGLSHSVIADLYAEKNSSPSL